MQRIEQALKIPNGIKVSFYFIIADEVNVLFLILFGELDWPTLSGFFHPVKLNGNSLEPSELSGDSAIRVSCSWHSFGSWIR